MQSASRVVSRQLPDDPVVAAVPRLMGQAEPFAGPRIGPRTAVGPARTSQSDRMLVSIHLIGLFRVDHLQVTFFVLDDCVNRRAISVAVNV